MSEASTNTGKNGKVNTRPRVSVLMPVRDCRDTLPRAVASVIAQSLDDWELVIVHDDDGAGLAWLSKLADARIRLLPNEYQPGRGGARQTALAASSGQFLAFLDADDWMYPDRLASQADALNADSDMALVSGGMVVADDREQPFGARRTTDAGRVRACTAPMRDSPVLNASSMLRGERARQLGYDTALQAGEDSDFLARYLAGGRFRQDAVIVYCYREFASLTWPGLRRALRAQRDRHLRQMPAGPARVIQRTGIVGSWASKLLIYRAALLLGGKRLVLRQRCRPLDETERAAFQTAHRAVEQALDRIKPWLT